MASASSCISLLVIVALASAASAQLSPTFYSTSCPRALATIKSAVDAAVAREPRMGASLLRLHFHDCFVQGCDASLLLNDSATIQSEQNAPGNFRSIRGLDVIENIKAQVEAVCPQTVSCADVLTVAARDSVVALGGPTWTVPLGRRDSTTANLAVARTDLPAFTASLQDLIAAFDRKGLSATDMVALSGAHTLGLAQCATFRNRIYNETNIDSTFATLRRANCPATGGDGNLAPFDTTPNSFDNAYFRDLLAQRGLLHSDQVLFNNGSTDNTVRNFASNAAAFNSAFITAMINMGNISPKTGSQGQIRRICSRIN